MIRAILPPYSDMNAFDIQIFSLDRATYSVWMINDLQQSSYSSGLTILNECFILVILNNTFFQSRIWSFCHIDCSSIKLVVFFKRFHGCQKSSTLAHSFIGLKSYWIKYKISLIIQDDNQSVYCYNLALLNEDIRLKLWSIIGRELYNNAVVLRHNTHDFL